LVTHVNCQNFWMFSKKWIGVISFFKISAGSSQCSLQTRQTPSLRRVQSKIGFQKLISDQCHRTKTFNIGIFKNVFDTLMLIKLATRSVHYCGKFELIMLLSVVFFSFTNLSCFHQLSSHPFPASPSKYLCTILSSLSKSSSLPFPLPFPRHMFSLPTLVLPFSPCVQSDVK